MRSDKNLGLRQRDLNRGRFGDDLGEKNSLSGHERDHIFIREGSNFLDLSGLSGLDHEGDGRALGLIDYDRDGWQDLVVVSANAPMTMLFHNQLGARSKAGMVALRFVGANHSDRPSKGSPRDGVGAKVIAKIGPHTLRRDVTCGEGFAAQNSATMLLGLGEAKSVASISVLWPSGAKSEVGEVAEGTLLTVYEDAAQSPDKSGEARQPYRVPRPANGDHAAAAAAAKDQLKLVDRGGAAAPKLTLYTSTATWCGACKKALPKLARLRESFDPAEVALYGLPVDCKDTREGLSEYVASWKPAYTMLADLSPDQLAAAKAQIKKVYRTEPMPATIICDAEGRVLKTTLGVPSVSDLRRLLQKLDH